MYSSGRLEKKHYYPRYHKPSLPFLTAPAGSLVISGLLVAREQSCLEDSGQTLILEALPPSQRRLLVNPENQQQPRGRPARSVPQRETARDKPENENEKEKRYANMQSTPNDNEF